MLLINDLVYVVIAYSQVTLTTAQQ